MSEETVPCGLCGKPTRMTGTKRCDGCWELESRIQGDPVLAAKILAATPSAIVQMPKNPTGAMLALIAGEDCERSFRTRQEALTVYYAIRALCRVEQT